jgi:hypothetical protein
MSVCTRFCRLLYGGQSTFLESMIVLNARGGERVLVVDVSENKS